MKKILLILSALAIGGCEAMSDAGCVTYGIQRPTMPELGADPLSEWVDVTDAAMTATCT